MLAGATLFTAVNKIVAGAAGFDPVEVQIIFDHIKDAAQTIATGPYPGQIYMSGVKRIKDVPIAQRQIFKMLENRISKLTGANKIHRMEMIPRNAEGFCGVECSVFFEKDGKNFRETHKLEL